MVLYFYKQAMYIQCNRFLCTKVKPFWRCWEALYWGDEDSTNKSTRIQWCLSRYVLPGFFIASFLSLCHPPPLPTTTVMTWERYLIVVDKVFYRITEEDLRSDEGVLLKLLLPTSIVHYCSNTCRLHRLMIISARYNHSLVSWYPLVIVAPEPLPEALWPLSKDLGRPRNQRVVVPPGLSHGVGCPCGRRGSGYYVIRPVASSAVTGGLETEPRSRLRAKSSC